MRARPRRWGCSRVPPAPIRLRVAGGRDAGAAEAMALLADSYSAYPYACGRDEDPALAESYYSRALDLKPNLVIAASNRAPNLRRVGGLAECVGLMNRMIRAFPDEAPL